MVSRIVVNVLCPGCPPESFRELLRDITDSAEARSVYEKLQREGTPREESVQDGGLTYEYLVAFTDGTRLRFLRQSPA